MNFFGQTNPPLPRMRNIALPATSEGMEFIINNELAATERIRPVAQLRLTSGPADTRAVVPDTNITLINGQPRNVHFVSNARPATNPPVRELELTFPNYNTRIVRSTIWNGYVSVDDVQRAVIEWMVQQQPLDYFYRRVMVSRQGTTVMAWVWVWRGLVQIGNDITRWSVELGFDV